MAGVDGRVALVTGASRGIGRTTAQLMASRGARVMCVARSEPDLASVGLEYAVADLGTPEGCSDAIAATERQLGPIDILVCNHGIGSALECVVWQQHPGMWDATMRINLDGPGLGGTSGAISGRPYCHNQRSCRDDCFPGV